ncbi:MAG: response regulator transcription factor [Isosphaeraceae bacterium]
MVANPREPWRLAEEEGRPTARPPVREPVPMALDPSSSDRSRVTRILVIDDDAELCDLMRAFFEPHGFVVEARHDGGSGLDRALSGGFDLILLDVMMPVLDGFAILKRLRRQSDVPVIMLTARTTQADRVAGLDAGADDYLPKPFGPEELLARIRAVLRRATRPSAMPEVYEVEGVRVVPQAREVAVEGQPVALTSIEFDMLALLVREAGRVVTRDELTASLQRRRTSAFDRVLDVHVSHLRRKLGARGALIRTVRGVGYLFRNGSASETSP